MNGCINVSVSLGFLRSRLQNEIKCVRILLREVLVWKEIGRASEKVRRATRRWRKESERPLSGSDLGGPAVSERWGKSLGTYFRQSQLSKTSSVLQEPLYPGFAGAAHWAVWPQGKHSSGFQNSASGALVNDLTLNKRSTRHILQAATVPNNDLKKVICATIF